MKEGKNEPPVVSPYEILAASLVNRNWTRVLDFGCGSGSLAGRIKGKRRKVYGCDIDAHELEVARKKVSGVSFSLLKKDGTTIYRDEFFDAVFLMGVLEHTVDEVKVLEEIKRILKPGGYLIIYGINKGLFQNFDTANLKFVAPKIHQFLYRLMVGKEEYEKEFIIKKDKGMFGDFSLGKRWHTHYSQKDLKRLLKNKFEVLESKYFGLFSPFLLAGEFIYLKLIKRRSRLIEKLLAFDQKFSNPHLAYFFLVKCKKV